MFRLPPARFVALSDDEASAFAVDESAAFSEFRELVTGAGAHVVAEMQQRRSRLPGVPS